MVADVVAALLDAFDHVGKVGADEAVQKNCGWKLELIEHPEDAPDPDTETVVAPRIIALRLWAAPAQERVVAAARHERKFLDVQRYVERQPLAGGPIEV